MTRKVVTKRKQQQKQRIDGENGVMCNTGTYPPTSKKLS